MKKLSAENLVRFCKALSCLAAGLMIFALGATFMMWPSLRNSVAQERIGLTTPAFVQSGVTNIKVVFLQCDWDGAHVIIGVRATDTNAVPLPTRQRVDFEYTGTTASNLMRTLNTNRFDTVSLHRKIILRLTADGHISGGTFSGVPE